MFRVERAWTSAPAPLSIVRPAHDAIPPQCRYVFVNNCEPTFAQHTAYFIQDQPRILRVMQHVTEQHRVEALVPHWKMSSVVRQVVDPCGGVTTDVQSHHRRPQHSLQVMRDEAIATADIKHISLRRQYLRDFERHVISASDLAAPSHAPDATFDGCG
jgi:hypothetical protein